jgi:hypothetical protein
MDLLLLIMLAILAVLIVGAVGLVRFVQNQNRAARRVLAAHPGETVFAVRSPVRPARAVLIDGSPVDFSLGVPIDAQAEAVVAIRTALRRGGP